MTFTEITCDENLGQLTYLRTAVVFACVQTSPISFIARGNKGNRTNLHAGKNRISGRPFSSSFFSANRMLSQATTNPDPIDPIVNFSAYLNWYVMAGCHGTFEPMNAKIIVRDIDKHSRQSRHRRRLTCLGVWNIRNVSLSLTLSTVNLRLLFVVWGKPETSAELIPKQAAYQTTLSSYIAWLLAGVL